MFTFDSSQMKLQTNGSNSTFYFLPKNQLFTEAYFSPTQIIFNFHATFNSQMTQFPFSTRPGPHHIPKIPNEQIPGSVKNAIKLPCSSPSSKAMRERKGLTQFMRTRNLPQGGEGHDTLVFIGFLNVFILYEFQQHSSNTQNRPLGLR